MAIKKSMSAEELRALIEAEIAGFVACRDGMRVRVFKDDTLGWDAEGCPPSGAFDNCERFIAEVAGRLRVNYDLTLD